MNAAKAKALRKVYRREVEDYLKNGGMYDIFMLLIKPKPQLIPKWLWLWALKFFVHIQEDPNNA